jgi:hypothetical protein
LFNKKLKTNRILLVKIGGKKARKKLKRSEPTARLYDKYTICQENGKNNFSVHKRRKVSQKVNPSIERMTFSDTWQTLGVATEIITDTYKRGYGTSPEKEVGKDIIIHGGVSFVVPAVLHGGKSLDAAFREIKNGTSGDLSNLSHQVIPLGRLVRFHTIFLFLLLSYKSLVFSIL